MQRLGRKEELATLRDLLRLLRGNYWLVPVVVTLGLLASLLEGVSLSLFIPLLHTLGGDIAGDSGSGRFVSLLQDAVAFIPSDIRLPGILAAVFLGIALKNLVSFANVATFHFVDLRIAHQIRTRLLGSIMNLPLARLDDDQSGRLFNVLANESWRTNEALQKVFSAVTSLCAITVFALILVLVSWQLSALALLCLAVIPAAVNAVTAGLQALSRRSVAAHSDLANRMWAGIAGWRVIHTFGRKAFETKRFAEASSSVRRIDLRLSLIAARSGPATEVLVTAVILMMALSLQWGLVDLASLAAFAAILYRLQPRVRELVSARTGLQQREGAVRAVMDLLGPDERDSSLLRAGRPFAGLQGTIRFDAVSFRYDRTDLPAVEDVSCTIRRGGMTAIVGPSGAGKSTLLDLLLRFYEPQTGRILVDDVPLAELDLDSWRARLAVVSQDPFVFDDTIRANILYGRPEADHEAVVAAARLAHADGFIERLPDGYDTVIGERGVKLSGGQRQRLTLARALIRDPDVLILDEATNALDSITEQAFQEALAEIAGRSTVIIVAHRLSTIESADHVVVLNAGRVVEQGSFRELCGAGGLFARMHRLQSTTATPLPDPQRT